MQTKHLTRVAKNLGGAISRNSPTILTVCAVGGLVTTVIFAVKATPRAYQIIEREKDVRNEEAIKREKTDYEQLTVRDYIRLTWRCYIPTAAIALASIGCIIGANHVNLRRNAALASVYGITEAAFKEYQAKVTETIGKNKELKLRDDISADHIKANPPGTNEIIFTGKGEVLCYDSMSGRYFKSDIEKIRKAINDLNETFESDMWISLNDLYYELGLSSTKQGELMGWNFETGKLKVTYSSQLTENSEPCLVINYTVEPKYYK